MNTEPHIGCAKPDLQGSVLQQVVHGGVFRQFTAAFTDAQFGFIRFNKFHPAGSPVDLHRLHVVRLIGKGAGLIGRPVWIALAGPKTADAKGRAESAPGQHPGSQCERRQHCKCFFTVLHGFSFPAYTHSPVSQAHPCALPRICNVSAQTAPSPARASSSSAP